MNVRVGEKGERSVRNEKALQQAERRIQSHRKSRKSRRRGKSPDNEDEVINAESTRSLRGKEMIVQNIQVIVERQCRFAIVLQKTAKSALLLSLKSRKANNEGFPICGHGEGAEHLQCHRTSK